MSCDTARNAGDERWAAAVALQTLASAMTRSVSAVLYYTLLVATAAHPTAV
jgi:hypothetical protein